MTKSKLPDWTLNDQWAVGRDAYNWILYKRGQKKDGSPGNWNAAGYYPTPEKLLMGLFHKLTLIKPPDKDLVKHLERCSERVTGLAARLSEELHRIALAGAIEACIPSKTRNEDLATCRTMYRTK